MNHSILIVLLFGFSSILMAKTSNVEPQLHDSLITPDPKIGNMRHLELDTVINGLTRTPPPIVVISYGRKSQDSAVNQKGVDATLKTVLSECKPPPKIEYVDDVEPGELSAHLKSRKFPQGAMYLVNSHGTPREGNQSVLQGLDLVSPHKLIAKAVKDGAAGATRNGDAVVKSILETAGFSNIWLSTCHSGSCSYFYDENPHPGLCLASECGPDESASANSPVFSKFSKLLCSAYGSDRCELFNKHDKNHDGRLSPEEIADYLEGPRKAIYERTSVSDNLLKELESDCDERGGKLSVGEKHKSSFLTYDFSGQDQFDYPGSSSAVKFFDPPGYNTQNLPPIPPEVSGDFSGGVGPEPGKFWNNLTQPKEDGRKRERSLGICDNSDYVKELVTHLYGTPGQDGQWSSCLDSKEKWDSIPEHVKKHCRIWLPPPISDPVGYEKHFPASQRKERNCVLSEKDVYSKVTCQAEERGVLSLDPTKRDRWAAKPYEPKIAGFRVSAPWCKGMTKN